MVLFAAYNVALKEVAAVFTDAIDCVQLDVFEFPFVATAVHVLLLLDHSSLKRPA